MSEDDAFIRAIVNNPGDDAPRLIYADWLDERGDPRGTYLRAVVSVTPGPKRTPTKSAVKDFLSEWKSIDAVWLARVSRPPLGICVETLRLSKGGQLIGLDELTRAESRLNMKLPAQYKAFLLNHNGGIPDPKWFRVPKEPKPELAIRFYPLSEESVTLGQQPSRYFTNIFDATTSLYCGPNPPPPPRRLLPIMAASYPVSILIGVVGVRAGCIYRLYDTHLGRDLAFEGPVKIADNLASFLASFSGST